MGFDPITLALAKQYTNEQRLGYIEPGMVVACDGKGDVVDYEDMNYVPAKDGTPDMTQLAKVTATLADGTEMVFLADELTIEDDGEMQKVIVNFGGQLFPMMLYVKASQLLYVWSEPSGHISSVEFAETIHTIDPKFIPGAVLPVVEIDKEGLLTEPSALSEAEAETIEKIVNAGNKYILVSVFVGGIPVATTILRKVIAEEEIAFMGMAGTGSVMIAKENGQWAIVVD